MCVMFGKSPWRRITKRRRAWKVVRVVQGQFRSLLPTQARGLQLGFNDKGYVMTYWLHRRSESSRPGIYLHTARPKNVVNVFGTRPVRAVLFGYVPAGSWVRCARGKMCATAFVPRRVTSGKGGQSERRH